MISYTFTAKDPATGKKITSKMSADNERAVVKAIKDQGYSPIEIKADSDQSGLFSSFKGKVKAKDRVIFSRQLSTLINAGLPLVQSLRHST